MEILEKLFEANSKAGKTRLKTLNEIDLKLKILQTVIRICWEVQALDENKYIRLQEPLQEIGKMLGGWIRSTKKQI